MHVNTMNVYLIVATTYEGGASEGERFALFAAGRTMRDAFASFARRLALRRAIDASERTAIIDIAMASFDIAALHAPDIYDTLRFVDDDGGAYTFDIVRVASEGDRRNKHARRALADSLAQAFDA